MPCLSVFTGLLANALVKTQLLQSLVGGECIDLTACFVVLRQGDGQLREQSLGRTIDNRLLQQTLGQTVVIGLHAGSLVEHTLNVVDAVADLQNLIHSPVGAGSGIQQVGVLGSTHWYLAGCL